MSWSLGSIDKTMQKTELYKTALSECEKNAKRRNGGLCELSVISPFSRHAKMAILNQFFHKIGLINILLTL
jgi:hypothetical protein